VVSAYGFTSNVEVVRVNTGRYLVKAFFEIQVRIQTDRGLRVVTSGRCHIVRHLMCVGAILTYSAIALILSSMWAHHGDLPKNRTVVERHELWAAHFTRNRMFEVALPWLGRVVCERI
jgi:hypothetical protein